MRPTESSPLTREPRALASAGDVVSSQSSVFVMVAGTQVERVEQVLLGTLVLAEHAAEPFEAALHLGKSVGLQGLCELGQAIPDVRVDFEKIV